MFIVDPFPPLSRIVAMLCVAVVHFLSKLQHIHENHSAEEEGVEKNKVPPHDEKLLEKGGKDDATKLD